MDGGARFISIRPPMEIQPIEGLPPAQGFIGGPPPPREEEPTGPPVVLGLAPCYEKKIFRIRDNDPTMNHLFIGTCISEKACKQLGKWLGSNTHMLYFCIGKAYMKSKSMKELCAGLRHNKSIRELEIGDNTIKKEEMLSLAPFIVLNPSLHTLSIEGCLGKCAVELLSTALASRTHSVENVSLDGNSMGGGESKEKGTFDTFIMALSKNTQLRRLSLMGNQVGEQACWALATLIKDPESNLKSLILRHNYIDDRCAAILADALSNNTQLNNLDLDRNERMTPKGLMKLLNCVCKIPSSIINLNVSWVCPRTDVVKSARLKIKLNEPLHRLGVQLYSDPRWGYTVEDMPKVKIVKERCKLAWREIPFYYNMRDGDSLRIILEADGIYAPPNLLDMSGGQCISQGSLQDTATSSNHTLTCLGYETALKRAFIHGPLLRECLDLNKRQDKSSAARIKMFRVHVQYNLNYLQFVDMDTRLMPRVLAWMERALGVNDNDRTYFAPPPPDLMVRYHLTCFCSQRHVKDII